MVKQLTVFITGANRGIGLGFCKLYLSRQYRVIATCRDCENFPKELINAPNLKLIELDLNNDTSIEECQNYLQQLNWPIELFINNAGITRDEPFGHWSREAFIESFSANAIAPALLIQALARQIDKHAKVIQLSSGLGSINTTKAEADPYCSYAMSKAALNMLTKQLSAYLGPETVTCALNPGWVQTDMGGQSAPETVAQAVEKMSRTIDAMTTQHNGQFLDACGDIIPW